jgi:hypothetical protein
LFWYGSLLPLYYLRLLLSEGDPNGATERVEATNVCIKLRLMQLGFYCDKKWYETAVDEAPQVSKKRSRSKQNGAIVCVHDG